jgi:hypothetical protein
MKNVSQQNTVSVEDATVPVALAAGTRIPEGMNLK